MKRSQKPTIPAKQYKERKSKAKKLQRTKPKSGPEIRQKKTFVQNVKEQSLTQTKGKKHGESEEKEKEKFFPYHDCRQIKELQKKEKTKKTERSSESLTPVRLSLSV